MKTLARSFLALCAGAATMAFYILAVLGACYLGDQMRNKPDARDTAQQVLRYAFGVLSCAIFLVTTISIYRALPSDPREKGPLLPE